MFLIPHSAFRIPHLLLILLIPITLYISSCVHPVYDGPVSDLGEQQSVWQYLSVYSIYQDSLPDEVGSLTPYQLFDMINDSLVVVVGGAKPDTMRGRYTEYVDDRGTSDAAGAALSTQDHNALIDVTESTVYLRLTEFSENTLDDFNAWRHYMNRGDFDNIVIDLRGNLGGNLNVTDSILGEFIPTGSKYIRTRRRVYDGNKRSGVTEGWKSIENAKRSPLLANRNLAVLVNRYSASASELMAAALKDNPGARQVHLIGDTTYGKGIGQVIAPRMGRKTLSVTFIQIEGVSERTGSYHKRGLIPDQLPESLIDERNDECMPYTCDRDLYAAVRLMEPEAPLQDILDATSEIRKPGALWRKPQIRETGAYVTLKEDALGDLEVVYD